MILNVKIKRAAESLWNYLKLDQEIFRCDCLIAMGSHDLRVAEHAAHLFLEGWAPLLVCSGGLGRLTSATWQEAEAYQFAKIARQAGIPESAILLEDQSTNTGENIRFSKALLLEKGLEIHSALLVQKPYMERRALATALKVWPEITYCVSSPPLAFKDYPTDKIPLEEVIQIMVGDFQRILEYPGLGYQIPQEVPDKVMQDYQYLVNAGFNRHVLSSDE